MDMGGSHSASTANACKISMLWNWNTVDSCFLSRTWHIQTKAMFAGSVIGVLFLVIAIEAVRRLGREYDRKLIAKASRQRGISSPDPDPESTSELSKSGEVITTRRFRPIVPSWGVHVLRSLIYGSQFTAAFLVMLLGMYYNGYILFAIFIGQTVGYFIFGRDTMGSSESVSGCCC